MNQRFSVVWRRNFCKGPGKRLRPEDFPQYDPKFKPSSIDYNRREFFKKKLMSPFKPTRKKFVSTEMKLTEIQRAIKSSMIKAKAQENNSTLDLKLGLVLVRYPVILPELEDWELDYALLQENIAYSRNKQYPAKKMNFGRVLELPPTEDNEKDPLPGGVEPWVYRTAAKDTKFLGPYLRYLNLDKRLESMESIADEEVTKVSEENTVSSEVDEIDDSWEDDGEDTNDVEAFLDDFELEVDMAKSTKLDLKEFKPAPRVTEDDLKNNLQSIYRKYTEPLYLIVKIGNRWRFPEFSYEESKDLVSNENVNNLGEICEQAFKEYTKNDCFSYFIGNAPAGFLHEAYDNYKTGDKAFGKSVFLFRAQLTENIFDAEAFDFNSLIDENVTDIAWITKKDIEELSTSFDETSKEYWSFGSMLLEN